MKKKKNRIDEISIQMLSACDGANKTVEQELLREIQQLDDINQKGRDGRTLLIHASCYDLREIVAFLLSKNAEINAGDDIGYTALHAAVTLKHIEIAKMLLSHGAEVNATDAYGNTPLQRASHLDPNMISVLMEAGADPTICNNFGISPLTSFAAYPEILEILEGKRN